MRIGIIRIPLEDRGGEARKRDLHASCSSGNGIVRFARRSFYENGRKQGVVRKREGKRAARVARDFHAFRLRFAFSAVFPFFQFRPSGFVGSYRTCGDFFFVFFERHRFRRAFVDSGGGIIVRIRNGKDASGHSGSFDAFAVRGIELDFSRREGYDASRGRAGYSEYRTAYRSHGHSGDYLDFARFPAVFAELRSLRPDFAAVEGKTDFGKETPRIFRFEVFELEFGGGRGRADPGFRSVGNVENGVSSGRYFYHVSLGELVGKGFRRLYGNGSSVRTDFRGDFGIVRVVGESVVFSVFHESGPVVFANERRKGRSVVRSFDVRVIPVGPKVDRRHVESRYTVFPLSVTVRVSGIGIARNVGEEFRSEQVGSRGARNAVRTG